MTQEQVLEAIELQKSGEMTNQLNSRKI